MNILITGAAGFIGSHLAGKLLETGHEVVGIDDLSSGRSENLSGLKRNPALEFVEDDVTNSHSMYMLMARCDAVVHLASAMGTGRIPDHTVKSLESNLDSTRTLLNVASELRKKVLIASSGAVYGGSNSIPFREDADIVLARVGCARWTGARSKLIDEFLALAHHHESGLPVVIVRLFHTIGARQSGQDVNVVPRFVGQALRGEPLTIYGTGSQTRCFADVGDVVDGLIGLLNCPRAVGGVFNLGSSHEITIEHLADKIIEMTAGHSKKQFVPYEEAHGKPVDDLMRSVPCLDRIGDCTGYSPGISLEQSLRAVIDDVEDRL